MLRIRSFQLEPLSTLIFTPLAFTIIIDQPNHGRRDGSSAQTIKPTIEGSSRTITPPLWTVVSRGTRGFGGEPTLLTSGKLWFRARTSKLLCHWCLMDRGRWILLPPPRIDRYSIIRGSASAGAAPAARFHIILVDVRPNFVHVLYVFV
jgi:hypothetical protein